MTPTITIGRARLYLANCADVLPRLGAVDALVSDVPYEFSTSGGGKFRKARNNLEKIAAKKINKGFDINVINPKLYKSVVMFCHNNQIPLVSSFLAQHYHRCVLCTWEKRNPMPLANKNYQANIEPYFHAWQAGAHPTGTLAELKRTITTNNGKSRFKHPTVKPDDVMNKIMRNVRGDLVVDPFAGTGSTGIAALRHGKQFIGIENDPEAFAEMCERFFELYSVEMPDTVSR